MSRYGSERGRVSLGGILSLAILAFLVYEGYKFGPVLFAQYEFKDAVVEEAKFSLGKSVQTLQNNLVKKAAELGLPITTSQISVTQQPTKTRIQVRYRLSVEWLPGRVYTWDVLEDQESVLF